MIGCYPTAAVLSLSWLANIKLICVWSETTLGLHVRARVCVCACKWDVPLSRQKLKSALPLMFEPPPKPAGKSHRTHTYRSRQRGGQTIITGHTCKYTHAETVRMANLGVRTDRPRAGSAVTCHRRGGEPQRSRCLIYHLQHTRKRRHTHKQ